MSLVLEDRVWKAHPLAPQHRLVLLAIAREVPNGQLEALVTRTLIAQALDTRVDAVTKALVAGECLNLCRVLKNGRVAFAGYDALLGQETPPEAPSGISAAPPNADPAPPPRPSPQSILTAFAKAWSARYGKSYHFTAGRDHRWARELGQHVTLEEITVTAAAYLADEDPFYSECAHAFSVFYKSFNKFNARCSAPVDRPPVTLDPRVARIMKARREA